MISWKNGGRVLSARSAIYPVETLKERFAYASLPEWVLANRPSLPASIIRLETVERLASSFVSGFSGQTMYAVKCNPDPEVLRALYKGGVERFDVASLGEIRLVHKTLPCAEMFFMHPIKPREAIREAYFTYGVRNFVLDTEAELLKILQETDYAEDLNLFVRLELPTHDAATISLAGKFGAASHEAPFLLRRVREYAHALGVTFHVGSQCMEPQLYGMAIDHAAQIIGMAGVRLDALDVGGGFPARYPGLVPPDDAAYFRAIDKAIIRNGFDDMKIYAEPGRKLVAEAGALVVRVEGRRGDMLYLNDGVFGGLWDMSDAVRFPFPMEHVRAGGLSDRAQASFRFAGPTCDSYDIMEGAFTLPADTDEGDWIIIDCMGGYSDTFRTGFNGFEDYLKIYL